MSFNAFWVALFATIYISRSQAQGLVDQVNVSICSWEDARGVIPGNILSRRRRVEVQQASNEQIIDSDSVEGLSESLLYFNLSSQFNASTNVTSLFDNVPRPQDLRYNNYINGVMFANDDRFYLYGGLAVYQGEPPLESVLAYDPDESRFLNTDLNGISQYVTSGAGVSSPSENLGFYISGMRAPDWVPIWDNRLATSLSKQMIKVDMAEPAGWNPVWSNITLPDYIPPRADAEAIWVPVSEAGIVVLIGGVINPESVLGPDLMEGQQTESRRISPEFMESVSIYDIASDICASDDSSYNIYIYGGYDGLGSRSQPKDDVYVLSLPSFEWILLYRGDSRRTGRKGHSCTKPYPDKMLIIGGSRVDSSCIDALIRVFNLNTGNFHATYDPSTWSAYAVPALVSARIGGEYVVPKQSQSTNTGDTNMVLQLWRRRNPDVACILDKLFLEAGLCDPNTRNISQPAEATETNSGGSPGFPVWAGGLLGGLVGLFVIAGLVGTFLFIWRRKVRTEAFQGTSIVMGKTVLSGPETAEGSRSVPEAGGEPVYEIHDQGALPLAELPVPENESFLLRSVLISGIPSSRPEKQSNSSILGGDIL
ncbi:hypothetical protein BJX99DRAFT_264714 [Aspergillus californicus]